MVILTHLLSRSLSLSLSRSLNLTPLPLSLTLTHCLIAPSQDEFELVGSILGLACYNNVIVDAHLPLPAYKKLMGLVRGRHTGGGRAHRERRGGGRVFLGGGEDSE